MLSGISPLGVESNSVMPSEDLPPRYPKKHTCGSKIVSNPPIRPSSTAEALVMMSLWDVPKTRKSSTGGWSQVEDDMLRVVVMENDFKKWKKIASDLNETIGSTRNETQCLHRWRKVIRPGLKKDAWTSGEDLELIALVEKHGAKKWAKIAEGMPGRAGKQCRDRWKNHLDPAVNKDPWTKEEENIINVMVNEHGSKWTIIAESLPGRTPNAIKNYHNSVKRRKSNKKNSKKRTYDELLVEENINGSDTVASRSPNYQTGYDIDVSIEHRKISMKGDSLGHKLLQDGFQAHNETW